MRHSNYRQDEVKVAVLEQQATASNTQQQYLAIALIGLSAIVALWIG